MDMQERWEKALAKTEIVRPRIRNLLTFAATPLPYIFLAESAVNSGDTVVRKGTVLVEKPSLILPSELPQFIGFDFEKEMQINEDMLTNFFIVRGVKFPSLKYNNQISALDVFEGRLQKAINRYSDLLQRREEMSTGLIIGPEDCWQFSVLLFVCTQAARSVNKDIKELWEEFKRRGRFGN